MCNGLLNRAGTSRARPEIVLNFFMLAPHGLPLQLTPTEDGCQLSLHHANGVVVERFSTVSSALRRARQINDRLGAPHRAVRSRSTKKRARQHRQR
jgi:hypothetical protein